MKKDFTICVCIQQVNKLYETLIKAFISYKNGRNVEGDTGEFVADFDGSHGWFQRNRSSADITITLKADGEYQNIQKIG